MNLSSPGRSGAGSVQATGGDNDGFDGRGSGGVGMSNARLQVERLRCVCRKAAVSKVVASKQTVLFPACACVYILTSDGSR